MGGVWIDKREEEEVERESQREKEMVLREMREYQIREIKHTLFLGGKRVFIVLQEKRPVWAAEQAYSG